ncbi:MAG: hypothetical protein HQL76_09080 [Magnetococcales bacterium]|nr:hypothetical protein [Magnetococcales bacterium]
MAFFLMLVPLTRGSWHQIGWWIAIGGICLFPRLAGMSIPALLYPLRKLRFFFLALFLLHGFFIPGSAVLPFSEWPSREGLMVGGQQSLRLGLMAILAWTLVRVSTTEDLIAGMCGLFGVLQRWGIPVMRWAALLSWTIECVGRLVTLASATRTLPPHPPHLKGWMAIMTQWSQRGGALLDAMQVDMARQEQRLRDQGILSGLPVPPSTPFHPGWQDFLIVFFSLMIFILYLLQ